MLQHNPHSHSLHCHGLSRTLEPFETRELEADDRKLAGVCPECRCRLIADETKTAKAPKAE